MSLLVVSSGERGLVLCGQSRAGAVGPGPVWLGPSKRGPATAPPAASCSFQEILRENLPLALGSELHRSEAKGQAEHRSLLKGTQKLVDTLVFGFPNLWL